MKSSSIVVFSLLGMLLLLPGFACAYFFVEDRTYADQAGNIGEKIAGLLVESGVCVEERIVCRGYYFTIDYVRAGLDIAILGIEEETLLVEIEKIVSDEFMRKKEMEVIILSAYTALKPPQAFEPTKKDKLIFKKTFSR